jgi:hypothetical protein
MNELAVKQRMTTTSELAVGVVLALLLVVRAGVGGVAAVTFVAA